MSRLKRHRASQCNLETGGAKPWECHCPYVLNIYTYVKVLVSMSTGPRPASYVTRTFLSLVVRPSTEHHATTTILQRLRWPQLRRRGGGYGVSAAAGFANGPPRRRLALAGGVQTKHPASTRTNRPRTEPWTQCARWDVSDVSRSCVRMLTDHCKFRRQNAYASGHEPDADSGYEPSHFHHLSELRGDLVLMFTLLSQPTSPG